MAYKLSDYQKVLHRFSGLRIVVLGDLMLDEYVFGATTRISREAPVLILKHERTVSLPGGGANPVSNIASLGATAKRCATSSPKRALTWAASSMSRAGSAPSRCASWRATRTRPASR